MDHLKRNLEVPKSIKGDPASHLDTDETSYWERQNPDEGVSPWDALFHFVNREQALELYRIDSPDLDYEFFAAETSSEEAKQFYNDHSLRRKTLSMKSELLSMLISGELEARGISSGAPLDAPPRKILASRWEDLELDLKNAKAHATGYTVSQILIFDPKKKVANRLMGIHKPSEEEVIDWYMDRLAHLESEKKTSSRDLDYADADAFFGVSVMRKWLNALREDVPDSWKKRGPKRKNANKS